MANTKSPSKAVAAAGPSVDPDQVLKATRALLAHVKKTAAAKSESEKKELLADDDESAGLPVWLTMTTKIHLKDSRNLQPGKMTIPHSLNASPESTICMVRCCCCCFG